MTTPHGSYTTQTFNLSGLKGISDKTLEMHFKLYDGYVKETNLLNEQIAEILEDGKIDQEEMPAYSELTRRLGFEYNGMVLHEYYFGNLKKGADPAPGKSSNFRQACADSFGEFRRGRPTSSASARCAASAGRSLPGSAHGRLSNHWITLHEIGNVGGFRPILVMDVWEHAFLLDYKPADRPKYIEAFFANVDWEAVDQRMVSGR